jgi:hypothetical protein
LKPQIEAHPSSLQAAVQLEGQSRKEAELSILVENLGKIPAYPVHIQLFPDVYSALWTDNFFGWLRVKR